MAELRDTLNLAKSPVAMKANLPQREPEIVKRWTEHRLYHRLLEKRSHAPLFLLHDGPPYANGELHMGHALNKSLKDFVVRYKALTGHLTPYVPGWDCHGLPIEHNVMKEMGGGDNLPTLDVRRRCRKYAEKYVKVQREGFIRLGCLGEWQKPYLTMDPLFESRILEAFAGIHGRGLIYRGKRPIHWCPNCRTALAASTAEAEYANHVSDSITVAFASTDEPDLAILIWTTTPWTLPANVAVAVREDLEYVTVKVGAKRYLLAEALLAATASACGWKEHTIEKRTAGKALEGRTFRHPFIDRTVPVILGEFVTTDTGTGVVHIAPGHGLEDYMVGLRYKLPVLAPVDASGRFTADATVCVGENVFDANPKIIQLLKDKGVLLDATRIEHSYPHCWRCKGPVIFRATSQWFMAVDRPATEGGEPLRAMALASADEVKWIPEWGKDRFVGTIKERPDWCLSRQRAWGVPLPAYHCENCGEGRIDAKLTAAAIELARAGRLDDWFQPATAARLTADAGRCSACGGALTLNDDILDVWFDSGVSWYATDMRLGGSRAEGEPPIADLYLEGSDQHRGWFQSSLWPSLALRGASPYRAVLTHGFMLDGAGKAMHKSAGNVIAPSDIMPRYGADIIRLWVASENYREDVRLSFPILDQVADTYRKIRNTWRFLVGNILDLPLDYQRPLAERPLLDQWAAARLAVFVEKARAAYESYSFHEVYRAMLEFSTNDLSSFYLDILKHRLYCAGRESDTRRSAQLTCREILTSTLQVMAPVLCFTTDEIWDLSPVAKDRYSCLSIHLSDWPRLAPADASVLDRFAPLMAAREPIMKALEEKRTAGEITTSQMASVTTPAQVDLALLAEICQVAEIRPGETITVAKTRHPKCPRCWRHLPLVDEVCADCRAVLGA